MAKEFTVNLSNPKDTAEEIAAKINTLHSAIEPSTIIGGVVSPKQLEDYSNKYNKFIEGQDDRLNYNVSQGRNRLSDLRYHGGGGDIFTVNFASASFAAPADVTTYYFGFPYDVSMNNTTPAIRQKIIPFGSVLRGAGITVIATAGATTESMTVSARINNTTDVLLSSAVTSDQTAQQFSVIGLSQTIYAGDKIEIKVLTPTWVTNPTNQRMSVDLYFKVV